METLEQNFNAQLKQLLLNEVTMETLFLTPLPIPTSHPSSTDTDSQQASL